jgi:hypothetical protein
VRRILAPAALWRRVCHSFSALKSKLEFSRMKQYRIGFGAAALAVTFISALVLHGQQAGTGAGPGSRSAIRTIAEADCTAAKLGTEIPVNAIGEPVSAVTVNAPQWHAEANDTPAYCSVEGSIEPVDKNAPPIRFGVALPGSWSLRGAQLGGGGMNGTIPRLTGGIGRGGPTMPLFQFDDLPFNARPDLSPYLIQRSLLSPLNSSSSVPSGAPPRQSHQ